MAVPVAVPVDVVLERLVLGHVDADGSPAFAVPEILRREDDPIMVHDPAGTGAPEIREQVDAGG